MNLVKEKSETNAAMAKTEPDQRFPFNFQFELMLTPFSKNIKIPQSKKSCIIMHPISMQLYT